MLRKLSDDEAAGQTSWLSDRWPPSDDGTGIDHTGDWPASAWVLNALYERDDLPSGLTHHESRQLSIDAGLEEPTVVNEVNLDALTVTTGVTLGFVERPEPPWRRLTWAQLGARDGFAFWAVDGDRAPLRHTPQSEWQDAATIPAGAFPSVGPTGYSSWPVNLMPPTEGSLDEATLATLITVLAEHTSDDSILNCFFYYDWWPSFGDLLAVHAGDQFELLPFVRSQQGMQMTPNSVWPRDRSWFLFTHYDLWATRVSGSQALIDALVEHPALDALRCG